MFYLANDGGDEAAKQQRYLVSARWDETQFDAYEAFVALNLKHPAWRAPVDIFRDGPVLYSVIPYEGEGLLVDEASPLSNARVLTLGQRLVGLLAFLHRHGVVVSRLTGANVLVAPNDSVALCDLDISAVHDGPVQMHDTLGALQCAGSLLYELCDVEAKAMHAFLEQASDGRVASLSALGRGLEGGTADWASRMGSGRVSGLTDVGLIRQLNEDNWGWIRLSERARLYIVADGMGGHDCGEVASQMAVAALCESAVRREADAPDTEEALEDMVRGAFEDANHAVKMEAESTGSDMGTTLIALLVLKDGRAVMGNVGDSRGYLFREGDLEQVSVDHSLVQKMVERGRISAEEARTHPHSNILLRTIGTEREVDVDVHSLSLRDGDRTILCSDGLWGEVEDRDISNTLSTYSDPRVAARELVRLAHHGGGKDNVTLMIVDR